MISNQGQSSLIIVNTDCLYVAKSHPEIYGQMWFVKKVTLSEYLGHIGESFQDES